MFGKRFRKSTIAYQVLRNDGTAIMLQNRWRKPGGVMARPVMFKTREAGRMSASDFDRNYPQYSPHYVITVKHKSNGEWVPVRSAGLARLLAPRLR
jgi:hypothetical protein